MRRISQAGYRPRTAARPFTAQSRSSGSSRRHRSATARRSPDGRTAAPERTPIALASKAPRAAPLPGRMKRATKLSETATAATLPKRVAAKASQVFALTWRDAGGVRNDKPIAAFRDFALDEACGCELAAGPYGMPPAERDFQMRAVWMGGRATRRTMTPATATGRSLRGFGLTT